MLEAASLAEHIVPARGSPKGDAAGDGDKLSNFGAHLDESIFLYNANYGAMRITASETEMLFEFYNRVGDLIDL